MNGNQSLERGLAILDLAAVGPAALGVREIARGLAISPSIVQRLVTTLVAGGYLEQEIETRRYRLGFRALVLGAAVRRDDRLLSVATEELEKLARDHRLNGYLGVVRGKDVIYLESIQSSGPISVRTVPGERANAHSTAMGKALLAELSPDQIFEIVGRAPYPSFTKHTITTSKPLLAELKKTKERGYALANQENIDQVLSVGAIIRDAQSHPIAALSVAYLSSERPARSLGQVADLVIAAANRCSRALGFLGEYTAAAKERVR